MRRRRSRGSEPGTLHAGGALPKWHDVGAAKAWPVDAAGRPTTAANWRYQKAIRPVQHVAAHGECRHLGCWRASRRLGRGSGAGGEGAKDSTEAETRAKDLVLVGRTYSFYHVMYLMRQISHARWRNIQRAEKNIPLAWLCTIRCAQKKLFLPWERLNAHVRDALKRRDYHQLVFWCPGSGGARMWSQFPPFSLSLFTTNRSNFNIVSLDPKVNKHHKNFLRIFFFFLPLAGGSS
jgi:hypothetical protein